MVAVAWVASASVFKKQVSVWTSRAVVVITSSIVAAGRRAVAATPSAVITAVALAVSVFTLPLAKVAAGAVRIVIAARITTVRRA